MKANTVTLPAASAKGGSSPAAEVDGKAVGPAFGKNQALQPVPIALISPASAPAGVLRARSSQTRPDDASLEEQTQGRNVSGKGGSAGTAQGAGPQSNLPQSRAIEGGGTKQPGLKGADMPGQPIAVRPLPGKGESGRANGALEKNLLNGSASAMPLAGSKQALARPSENAPAPRSSTFTRETGGAPGAGLMQLVRDPRAIALAGGLGAIALGAGAHFGFNASLLESVFWSVGFAGLGLGAASFSRLTNDLAAMRRSLDHTRKHMATTARVLSETLEQAEMLTALSKERPQAAEAPITASVQDAPIASPAAPTVNHSVHLEGLVNVARAQVILAHKSEADMSVLSTLVSNLAEAVDDQEKELTQLRADQKAARTEAEALRRQSRETAEIVRQIVARKSSASLEAGGLDMRLTPADRASIPGIAERSPAREDEPEIAADPVLVRRLADAFAEKTHGFALQPIVTLPQRKVKLYEMSLALDGSPALSAEMMGAAAREAGLGARYDRLLVSRALRMIRYFRSKNRDISILCEVTGAMLAANPAFDELVAELRNDREAARSLVIGFPQKAYGGFRQGETDLLRFFTELGVRFGVMRLTDMTLDPAKLAADNVRMVGIDVDRLLAAIPTGLQGLDVHVADLAGLFARRDIDLMVQNVRSERELLDIMDFGTPLGQGPLLGEPRPINPNLIEAASEPETALPPAPPVSQERQPLRNFLRRA